MEISDGFRFGLIIGSGPHKCHACMVCFVVELMALTGAILRTKTGIYIRAKRPSAFVCDDVPFGYYVPPASPYPCNDAVGCERIILMRKAAAAPHPAPHTPHSYFASAVDVQRPSMRHEAFARTVIVMFTVSTWAKDLHLSGEGGGAWRYL